MHKMQKYGEYVKQVTITIVIVLIVYVIIIGEWIKGLS